MTVEAMCVLCGGMCVLCGGYLEGLSKGSSSIVLQPVSPCDKHL